MNGLTICPRCKKQLIIEEYRNHPCPVPITDVLTIGITEDYGTLENRDGDLVHTVKTVKGQILRLVKCEHEIPHNLPHQPKVNTNNTTDKVTEPVIRNCYLLGCFFLLLISVGVESF